VDAARGAPTLLLLADPECDACVRAREDLRYTILPEELGVRATVLLRTKSGEDEVFDRGPFPAYYLFDENGTCLGGIRGYRHPALVRAWMRERLPARAAP
jgi:hypothetical protein